MTVLWVQHVRNKQIIWKNADIRNLLHSGGEQFSLQVIFGGLAVPAAYYLGLDNRTTVAISDTLTSLIQEPMTNGYVRQKLIPQTNFAITQSGTNYLVSTDVVTFSASSGSWGPVQNIFLSTSLDNSGVLISTATVTPFTVEAGDNILMQLGMSLGNPAC